MSDSREIRIRETAPADLAAIEGLYPAAFPDEDLLGLVADLHRHDLAVLSLVALSGTALVAHVLFTPCLVEGVRAKVSMLAPLAVLPKWQGQGIGTLIVKAGLQHLEDDGVEQVFVLGDPAYYGRFGFTPESGVAPPYALPPEWASAWQSKCLGGTRQGLSGKLGVPGPWQRPELWGP